MRSTKAADDRGDPAVTVDVAKATTAMTADPHLIERSVDLKQQMVEFIQQRRFDRAIRQALQEDFGPYPPVEDEEFANFADRFMLETRLPDGRTVVETFVAEHPEFPEEERAMLLGWRDVVEGIFEVERRDGEALVVVNLLDELTYRVRSNMGPASFRQMPPRSFLNARLIPIGDEWLLSGATQVLPAMARADVYGMAAELAVRFPQLVFRNPEKLAQAWEMQREERRIFLDFFGTDLVVLPGRELAVRMRAYAHYRHYEARDEEGKTVAERVMEERGASPPQLEFPFAADFTTAETVGLIYDEEEGLAFFIDFGMAEETFANPALADDHKHRQAVLRYLRDESVSPLPLRRLAACDPARASQVFQRLLKKPRFSWERDGEALLRKHKPSFFDKPVFPAVMPLSDRLARARGTAPAGQLDLADFPPARPRDKVSWKLTGRRE